jgi:hypothetical protein
LPQITRILLSGIHEESRDVACRDDSSRSGERRAEALSGSERKEPFWAHAFDVACARYDIVHRLTKPKHPWNNGQVERMNRTIKDVRSSASTTTPTTSCAATSPTSSALTASPSGSRPLRVSHPTNTFAGQVLMTQSRSAPGNTGTNGRGPAQGSGELIQIKSAPGVARQGT